MALVMASKLTPCALALSRSMSICNWGASSRPSGRTPGQHLALRGHAQHLVAGIEQGFAAQTSAVLQTEAEARRRTQFGNGRRAQREDEGIADARQRAERAAREALRRTALGRALGPVLERDEGQRGVLTLTREAEAQHTDHALHLGLLEHEAFHLLHHVFACARGWRRAATARSPASCPGLRWAGTTWAGAVDHHRRGHDGQVNDERATSARQQRGHTTFVALGGA